MTTNKASPPPPPDYQILNRFNGKSESVLNGLEMGSHLMFGSAETSRVCVRSTWSDTKVRNHGEGLLLVESTLNGH